MRKVAKIVVPLLVVIAMVAYWVWVKSDGVHSSASSASPTATTAKSSGTVAAGSDGSVGSSLGTLNPDSASQLAATKAQLAHIKAGGKVQDTCRRTDGLGGTRKCTPPVGTYDRIGQFGDSWMPVSTKCNTREEVLARQLVDVKKRTQKGGCFTVSSGVLHDPYTGKVINFTRGPKTSLAVQIDHVFPLALAWDSGASQWTQKKREAFANDLNLNLIASDGPTNVAKSNKTLSQWYASGFRFPSKAVECTYVSKYVRVADVYGLNLTPGDFTLIGQILPTCTQVLGSPGTADSIGTQYWG